MLAENMSYGATQRGPAAAGETSVASQGSLGAECELECMTSHADCSVCDCRLHIAVVSLLRTCPCHMHMHDSNGTLYMHTNQIA